MPYRAVYTPKLSLCGDTYVELSVVPALAHDEVIDSALADEPLPQAEVDNLLGKQLYENVSPKDGFRNDDTFGNGLPDGYQSEGRSDEYPSVNSRILDPDWDTIPF